MTPPLMSLSAGCGCRCHFDFVLCANLAMPSLVLSDSELPVTSSLSCSWGPGPIPPVALLYTWLRPKCRSTYISFTSIFARWPPCNCPTEHHILDTESSP